MASTYSTLKIELIGTGEQSGTWGTTTNTNLGTAIEEAIVGSADVSFTSADVTLTLTDTNAAQIARNLRLNLTGTSGGARNLILGSGCQIEKPYIVNNGLADTVTVKNTTGNGVAVPAGKTMWVYNNGTDVVDAVTHLTSLTLGTVLAASFGGTGNAFFSVSGPATSVKTYTFPNENMSVGYRNIPAVADKTAAYTLTTAEIGKVVGVGSGGSIEIPDSVFAAGDAVLIFNNTAGDITITCTITTAYIAGADADVASVTLATRGVCNILFLSGTACVLTGNIS